MPDFNRCTSVVRRLLRRLSAVTALCVLASMPGVSGAVEGEDCGPLTNAYGPYDYTNPYHRREKLPIVEANHFGPPTVNLERGMRDDPSSPLRVRMTNLIGDLSYTLRAFPNHPVALDALARLHVREGLEDMRYVEPKILYSMACWFDRAQRFKPQDYTVRLIHGISLYRIERYDDALDQYKVALAIEPESAEVQYNTGLLYLKLKDYESALEHAKVAYSLGYPLPGLRNALKNRNYWPEETVSQSEPATP